MSDTKLYRRLIRRETHSPRSGLAIVLAIIVIIVLAYFGVEFVLRLLGQRALLAEPAVLAAGVLNVPDYMPAYLIGGGAVVALIGLLLVIASLSGGRRPRHSHMTERVATIVDNEVIASSLARHAARAAHSSPDNTTVTVSHRQAFVRLVPTSGTVVDKAAVVSVVDTELEQYGLAPAIRSRVDISDHGRVGA